MFEPPTEVFSAATHVITHEYVVLFFTLARGCSFELYNIDCKYLETVVRNNRLNPAISGTMLLYHLFIVVEMDIPWDDSQVQNYGQSFKAWGEDEIESALAGIKESMPMNRLSYVVIHCFFKLLSSTTIGLKETLFIDCWLRNVKASLI